MIVGRTLPAAKPKLQLHLRKTVREMNMKKEIKTPPLAAKYAAKSHCVHHNTQWHNLSNPRISDHSADHFISSGSCSKINSLDMR